MFVSAWVKTHILPNPHTRTLGYRKDSMTDKLKVGVFGVGSLGQWHARIYSEMPNVELVGVFDTDPQRAREIADKYRTRPFDRLDELASSVEAASVAAPTDRHHEVFLKLANRNCHMLMEKPIAATLQQAREMVAIAERKNLTLQVGHVERFNPVIGFLEANLTTPRFIEAERLAPFPPARPGSAPRGTEVSVVLDLMIHDLDIILHLVRSPLKTLHAVGVAALAPTEDIANARLVFENGCVANVTASRISRERLRKLRVFQEDAYLSLDYMNQSGLLSRKANRAIETVPVPIEKGDALERQLASFVDCVQCRKTPVVCGRQATDALDLAIRICDAIKENPS